MVDTYAAKFLSVVLTILSGNMPDNANPRDKGPPKNSAASRALAAHQNNFEMMILFTATVTLAVLAELPRRRLEDLCTLFVLLRVVYTLVYTFLSVNQVLSVIRSAVFFAGLGVVVKVMVMASEKKYGYILKVKA